MVTFGLGHGTHSVYKGQGLRKVLEGIQALEVALRVQGPAPPEFFKQRFYSVSGKRRHAAAARDTFVVSKTHRGLPVKWQGLLYEGPLDRNKAGMLVALVRHPA
jgi:hypothetical protein